MPPGASPGAPGTPQPRPSVGNQWHHRPWLVAHQGQDRPFRGGAAARFLRHLTTHISVRLLVIWDGNPIHRCQEVKAFLASPAGQGVHLEQLPAYAPELNPEEGVWNYLKRVELKNVICQHLGQLSYELGKAIKRLRQKPHIIRACAAQAGLV
jgi:transposase